MISVNVKYWIWLTQTIGYNNPKVKRIFQLYPDISKFYIGGEKEWRLCGILTEKDIAKLNSKTIDVADRIIKRCIELKYSILCIDDEDYPECLFNIEAPPALIYVNGKLPDLTKRLKIGIVGTRSASRYGVNNSYRFAYALARYGAAIISGGALGVDCASHRGALKANGVTICVRGCGINCSYLRENAVMREQITEKGAVISEYPPDETPRNYYFPARNRIISALSDGLLVIEASNKSGSLITANYAGEQGKKIFALLADNTSKNEGSNSLIKEGLAEPVTDFMDVLCAFDNLFMTDEMDYSSISVQDIMAVPVKGISTRKRAQKPVKESKAPGNANYVKRAYGVPKKKAEHKKDLNLSDTARKIYEYINDEPVHIDKISNDLQIPVFKVLTALSQLEMLGAVKALQGRKYVIA